MKTFKKFGAGRLLTTILVIFMLSWVTLLTSCTATVRTPRNSRSTVIIEGQVSGSHQDHDRRSDRLARRERREHNN
jgi:hypothetical protein